MAFVNDSLRAGGIVMSLHLAKIAIMSVADRPGVAGVVLGVLADQGINVHCVVETTDQLNRSHFVICVEEVCLQKALAAVSGVQDKIEAERISHRPGVALVSVFGPHFRDIPGSASRTCRAISEANSNILAISTSFSSITCMIDGADLDRVVLSLRQAFDVPESAVCVAADGLSRRSKC